MCDVSVSSCTVSRVRTSPSWLSILSNRDVTSLRNCRISPSSSVIAALMKTFTYKFASGASDYCANNWIWKCLAKTKACKLDGTSHRSFCA